VNREKKEGCGCVWRTAAATVPRRTAAATAADGCCCGDDDGWHGGGRRLRGTAADGCCCTAADGATAGVGCVGRLLRSSCGLWRTAATPGGQYKDAARRPCWPRAEAELLLRHACL